MSELFDRFTEFPELVDYRQDQLIEVYRALDALRNITSEDPNQVIQMIQGLDLQRVHRNYQNKCNDHIRGNRSLQQAIRNVTFRAFKPVIGDINYV